MTREEFLRQLSRLLGDIPENERREAVEYYENYFEDAGPEKEAEIIQELGSPQKVADSIKRDLFGENCGNYGQDCGNYGRNYGNCGGNYGNYGACACTDQAKQEEEQRRRRNRRNVWLILLAVLTFPIWVGLVAAAFGILVGILAGILGLAVGAFACVLAFFAAGIGIGAVGVARIFTGAPGSGFLIASVGAFLLALGILGLAAAAWAAGWFVPWAVRGIIGLCQRPFRRKEASL